MSPLCSGKDVQKANVETAIVANKCMCIHRKMCRLELAND